VRVEASFQGGVAVFLRGVAGYCNECSGRQATEFPQRPASAYPSISGRPMSLSTTSGVQFVYEGERTRRVIYNARMMSRHLEVHAHCVGRVVVVVNDKHGKWSCDEQGLPLRLARSSIEP